MLKIEIKKGSPVLFHVDGKNSEILTDMAMACAAIGYFVRENFPKMLDEFVLLCVKEMVGSSMFSSKTIIDMSVLGGKHGKE